MSLFLRAHLSVLQLSHLSSTVSNTSTDKTPPPEETARAFRFPSEHGQPLPAGQRLPVGAGLKHQLIFQTWPGKCCPSSLPGHVGPSSVQACLGLGGWHLSGAAFR